jgi:hypothetical protein
MKRITLNLTVTPGSVPLLNVLTRIHGNINPVIEILGASMHRDNVLVDLCSFRIYNGRYEFKSRNGLLGHTRILDILNNQSGLLMIRPGEVVTFSFGNQHIIFFNQPTLDGDAFLKYIVSKEKLRRYLDRELEQIRKGAVKKPRAQKVSLILNDDWSPGDDFNFSTSNLDPAGL